MSISIATALNIDSCTAVSYIVLDKNSVELGITGWKDAAVARRKRAPALYIVAALVCFVVIYML